MLHVFVLSALSWISPQLDLCSFLFYECVIGMLCGQGYSRGRKGPAAPSFCKDCRSLPDTALYSLPSIPSRPTITLSNLG